VPLRIGNQHWIYTILANLSAHQVTDVSLFAPHYSRWECVFQPTSTTYLNPIEPR